MGRKEDLAWDIAVILVTIWTMSTYFAITGGGIPLDDAAIERSLDGGGEKLATLRNQDATVRKWVKEHEHITAWLAQIIYISPWENAFMLTYKLTRAGIESLKHCVHVLKTNGERGVKASEEMRRWLIISVEQRIHELGEYKLPIDSLMSNVNRLRGLRLSMTFESLGVNGNDVSHRNKHYSPSEIRGWIDGSPFRNKPVWRDFDPLDRVKSRDTYRKLAALADLMQTRHLPSLEERVDEHLEVDLDNIHVGNVSFADEYRDEDLAQLNRASRLSKWIMAQDNRPYDAGDMVNLLGAWNRRVLADDSNLIGWTLLDRNSDMVAYRHGEYLFDQTPVPAITHGVPEATRGVCIETDGKYVCLEPG